MDLARTQLVSLVTKGITTALGLVQSIIVIRLLTADQFGLVGLVMGIGGVIGVSQHLGLVDGVIREVAVLKKKADVGKIVWVSHLVRQLVTVPLSIALFFLAGAIASGIYNRPEIVPYLQIFAMILVLQGLQDVLGATLTGIKQFGALYGIQIVTAVINIIAFGWLTWRYGITGFFWAMVVTTAIMVGLFIVAQWKYLRGHLGVPSGAEVKSSISHIARISVYMYLARILFMVWQKLPLLVLGGTLAATELGHINAALAFGSRLTIIAMALSEVNLSWMSSLFANERDKFKQVVTRNMQRVLLLLMGITVVILFFGPDVLSLIRAEYEPARPIILIMTLAFFLYSLVDIGTSSLFVPADKPRDRSIIFAAMAATSAVIIGWLLLTQPSALLATYGVLAGAIVAYVLTVIAARRSFAVQLLTPQLAAFLGLVFVATGWLLTEPGLGLRILAFIWLSIFILWEASQSKLLPIFSNDRSPMTDCRIICFAGGFFDAPIWTNRQNIMSRVAKHHPVLYVEPRVWIFRYLWDNRSNPARIFHFFMRVVWYEQITDYQPPIARTLFIKSQWNLIPGSRENKAIAWFNHYILNRWNVLLTARFLGFRQPITDDRLPISNITWIYDTEAAEYLDSCKTTRVIYDCVDDHAVQAGPDRNPERVREEEAAIMHRADLITVTSRKLYEDKKHQNANVHLVLNAGDVELFSRSNPSPLPFVQGGPIIGTVGTLDSYKYDFDLIYAVAQRKPDWQFVFIGQPIVSKYSKNSEYNKYSIDDLEQLPNIHILANIPRQQVPTYVQQFDICMIPYRASVYNAASFPLKFWEFMASGKPIVFSGLPELELYATNGPEGIPGVVSTIDASSFIQKTAQLLVSKERGSAARRTEAGRHSWEQRTQLLLKLLSQLP